MIAYQSGSVPEVVEDGVTGFIVDDEEQAIRALKNWVPWTDEWSAPSRRRSKRPDRDLVARGGR
ncbi:glycosyltransferase involved in cell wall biosynthesis [Bradyrhizobium canariense]|nr:glycosyltransferase involved in cell wall biosynthesis [Bradyrhizobium canariense]